MPDSPQSPREQEKPGKRRPGRPKTSPLDPTAQNREALRRHREKKRAEGRTGVELWIKNEVRDAILEAGQTLQEAADEAFALLMAKRARKGR